MQHCHGCSRNALTHYHVNAIQSYFVPVGLLPFVERLACRVVCLCVSWAGAGVWSVWLLSAYLLASLAPSAGYLLRGVGRSFQGGR
jgi:hypothetical protein